MCVHKRAGVRRGRMQPLCRERDGDTTAPTRFHRDVRVRGVEGNCGRHMRVYYVGVLVGAEFGRGRGIERAKAPG
jgi:hypothetical protein